MTTEAVVLLLVLALVVQGFRFDLPAYLVARRHRPTEPPDAPRG